MALEQVSESEEDEYHSLDGGETERGEPEYDEGEVEEAIEPPLHPVPSMQAAFEESIRESTEGDEDDDADTHTIRPQPDQGAEARRTTLLEAQQYDDSWATRWKQKASARHHPLLKLMSQIVFGMHLLSLGQAKSNEEVVRILQTHVNEVDTFLERTAEDFKLAIADIDERIKHLRLPMEHLSVFNTMLDDRKFRSQLLDGNDKIEKIIDRTGKAMNAALMDVQKGVQANHELGKYLDSIRDQWPRGNTGIAEVFGAMRGNEQGWNKYLKDLQAKGSKLGKLLVQLGTVIGEMSKLAAAASRRNRPTSQTLSPSRAARSAPNSPGLRSKFYQVNPPPVPAAPVPAAPSLNKPLPSEPDSAKGAARMSAVPVAHPVPFKQRWEQPRQSPQSPPPNTKRTSSLPNGITPRPKSAGTARDSRVPGRRTTELAEFLKHSGPLRSNPPDHIVTPTKSEFAGEKKLGRSQSQGANNILNVVAGAEQQPAVHHHVGRSKSQGAGTAMIVHGPQRGNRESKENRPSSRGAEKALDASQDGRKDSVASTGFARRISKRMKHAVPVDDSKATGTSPALSSVAPTDSAYASATERKPSTASARPPSRFGRFSRFNGPLTPSPSSNMSYGERLQAEANGGVLPPISNEPSMTSVKGSTKSMTKSFRNLFHRRNKTRTDELALQ